MAELLPFKYWHFSVIKFIAYVYMCLVTWHSSYTCRVTSHKFWAFLENDLFEQPPQYNKSWLQHNFLILLKDIKIIFNTISRLQNRVLWKNCFSQLHSAAQYLDGRICKFMQFLYKSIIGKCPGLVPHVKPFKWWLHLYGNFNSHWYW